MATPCTAQFTFTFHPQAEPVIALLNAAYASSAGGAILLTALDAPTA